MEFLKLKIDNFLAIGDAPEIALKDQGLVLIQGQNEDDSSATSNGVGKSSIADALCWAVYGETARGITGDGVVNKVAKKNCSVSITLRDGDIGYRITRYRKHKDKKNSTVVECAPSEGALFADISKGTEKETQELIDSIMGCSLDVFMAAIYAGQEVTPDLPKMTDKQLKLLIEEAAGVERIEAAYEIARKKLGTAKDALTIFESGIAATEKLLDDAKIELEKKKLEAEAFDKGREGRAKIYKELADARKDVLRRFLTSMKGIDTDTLNKRNSELGVQLAGHSDMLKRRDEIKRKVAEAVRKADAAKIRLDDMTDQAKRLKSAFDNAEEEIKKPCPSCGKPGNEHDLESYRKHVKLKLLEAVENAKTQKTSWEAFVAVKTALEAELTTFEATIPDVSALTAEQGEINTKLREHADLRVKAIKEKAEMDRVSVEADKTMTETNPHASAITMAQERIDKHTAYLKEAREKLAEKQREYAIAESVVKVFGPAGVRAHILDTVTPFLNDRTADYLSALSDGNISATWTTLTTTAKGDLKEKFNIEVSNTKGAESFGGLSGGEKRKVRLATMLALQDLVSSRATKPINLWIGDEIDDALDRAGLERLMGILERKARERGTVMVISHSDLRDWIDNVTTVVKREGLSTIEGAMVV